MEATHAGHIEDYNGRLDFHHEPAGIADKAVDYYQIAATPSQAVLALRQVAGFLNLALILLNDLPEGPHRDRLQRALQESIGR
jgi:hypothetical protein